METPLEEGVGCGGDSLRRGGRVWWRLLYHLDSTPILRFHLHLGNHRTNKKLLQLIIMIMINDCRCMYFIYLKMKVIIAVINTTKALVKIKLEKKIQACTVCILKLLIKVVFITATISLICR